PDEGFLLFHIAPSPASLREAPSPARGEGNRERQPCGDRCAGDCWMSIELGHFALILAFAIATVSAIVGLLYWRGGGRTTLYLRQSAVLQFLLVAAAFAALIQA